MLILPNILPSPPSYVGLNLTLVPLGPGDLIYGAHARLCVLPKASMILIPGLALVVPGLLVES